MTSSFTCPLCLKAGTKTDEDVLPMWSRRIHKKLDILTGPKPNKTLLDLCSTCNGNLNTQIENRAFLLFDRLVESTGMELSRSDQMLVARWTIKTDLMLLLRRAVQAPPGVRVLPPKGLARVRSDILRMVRDPHWVPPGSVVRIGRVIPSSTPIRLRDIRPMEISDPTHMRSFLTIANVVTESITFAYTDAAAYADAARIDARMLVMDPEGPAQHWPPADTLDTEVYAELLRGSTQGPGSGWGFDLNATTGVPRRVRP